MTQEEEAQPFVFVPLDDSPASRLFVELSGYGADLTEARHALDLAIQGLDGESALSDAREHLVRHAVIAYCRTVQPSKVRRKLTDHITIPANLLAVHQQVKNYRNATVAHSQSELATTYGVGILSSDTLEVRDVAAWTLVVPLPRRMLREIRTLLETVERLLDEALAPVRADLVSALAEADPRELQARSGPYIQEKLAHEFNAMSTRRPFPTQQTIYWDVASDDASQD